jgi:ABC-type thiamin/hydroxymethylpyrimidine transport system permease subunit
VCMCFKANDFAYVSAIWPLVLVNVLTERGGGEVTIGIWCLTPLLTIFPLYRGGQFCW